jgi:hypothetical protein
MALGFNVHLIGVPRFSYKDRRLQAWRCDPSWFDGWELARDKRMTGGGYPTVGLFSREEVLELHTRYSKRVRGDGTIRPTAFETRIYSDDDDGLNVMPDVPDPCTVEEVDQLLADCKTEWIIIELWDRS